MSGNDKKQTFVKDFIVISIRYVTQCLLFIAVKTSLLFNSKSWIPRIYEPYEPS
jgi:hypothetical protein